MSSELVSLRDARERAIAALSDLFTHDELDIDEFDRRITIAHRAGSLAEIEGLLADFPDRAAALQQTAATTLVPAAAAATTALVPSSQADRTLRLTAVMGGVVREGQWSCPRTLKAVMVMGGAVLDFREARLAAGVTEVKLTAVMGGALIIVPPGLAVEIDGTAIMGGFDHVERTPPEMDPERPSLRIHGLAVMGGVSVETRLPGEGEHEAQRRRRKERKELGAGAREGRRQLPEPK